MIRRLPCLTLAVFAVTAGTTAAMLVWSGIGAALQRDGPLIEAGQPWRMVTAWLVETDGWGQVVVNLGGLLIFGTLVERLVGRRWWIVGYVTAGLAGEFAGLSWQPVGGGNSVADCGLIGSFAVWQLLHLQGPGRFVGPVFWLGLGLWLVLHQDIHGPAILAGLLVGGFAALATLQRLPRHA